MDGKLKTFKWFKKVKNIADVKRIYKKVLAEKSLKIWDKLKPSVLFCVQRFIRLGENKYLSGSSRLLSKPCFEIYFQLVSAFKVSLTALHWNNMIAQFSEIVAELNEQNWRELWTKCSGGQHDCKFIVKNKYLITMGGHNTVKYLLTIILVANIAGRITNYIEWLYTSK